MADWSKICAVLSRSYLDLLPEEIYDKSDGSHIVRIMDALCGDSGVGRSRKKLLLKRLQTSLSTTRYGDLDTVYSQIFALPRLDSEEYTYSTDDLLTTAEIAEMDNKDAHYRTRIWAYMQSFMWGPTITGLELCAKAGVGDDCEIVDLTKYWQSINVPEGDIDYRPLTGATTLENDGSHYLVVVMRDSDVTAQESKYICDTLSRLAPADATFTIVTRDDVGNVLDIDDMSDIDVVPRGVSASTRWWDVLRYVTGRADWDYVKYPSLWIEPNVRKEAPRQALVNHQEEQNNYTYLANSVSASTEHVGYYNVDQQALFPSLTSTDVMYAKYSLSKVSSKWYTSSFYGGEDVVDFSYPIDLVNELTSGSDESARGSRFWSSNEALSGTEWLQVGLKRTIPINTLNFNMSCKPIKAVPYASSATDDNGDPIWLPIQDSDGRTLSYSCRSWVSSAVSGEMVSVSFSFPVLRANAIKIEFERLSLPYGNTLASGAIEEETFPYSVEVENLQIGQNVFSESDYRDAVYVDPFGNKVETELQTYDAANVLVDDDSLWISQPDIATDSIEYLILDVRDSTGAARKIDYIDIDSVYDGCQMNIYSSDDGTTWTPYPGIYTLQSGRFSIAARTVSYIELEFTNLCPIPYEIISSDISVTGKRYPYSVRNEVATETEAARELSTAQQYLTTADEASSLSDSTSDQVGLSEAYDELDNVACNVTSSLDSTTSITPFSSNQYRSIGDTSIYGAYGTDMAVENNLDASTQSITALDSQPVLYFFPDVGEHTYEYVTMNRTMNLAFVVGIRYVNCGLSGTLVKFDGSGGFVMDATDGRHLHDNAGWESDGDRMKPSTSDNICSLETNDLATAEAFRTFDFAVNQSEPYEKLEYPSDMSQEWSGINSSVEAAEFGTNGTTLMCTPSTSSGYGVSSDLKLVHSESIAQASVDMFTEKDGKWQLECVDTYGEQVFSMLYNVPKRTWTTVGTTFTPQPGGGWWNRDYSYRVSIPLEGPLVKGQSIFLPVVDFAALKTAGIETGSTIFDMKDLRIVYYNGIDCQPISIDLTGNEQVWFDIQQDVPSGQSADGAYHRDVQEFYGAYYIYFGNSAEQDAPDIDHKKLFTSGDGNLALIGGDSQASAGTTFSKNFSRYELDDIYRIGDGSGWLTLNLNVTGDALVQLANGTTGTPDIRYIFDYEDEERTISLYAYEKQLFFKIVEPDGFENTFVSQAGALDTDLASVGAKLLIRWGARGSANVYVNGALSTDATRRDMRMYLSSGDGTFTAIPCIDNVYDEAKYDNGIY